MVAISKLINNGLLLVGQSVYQDLATPQQSAVDQYNVVRFLGGSGPYVQREGFGLSTDVPAQCTLEQVHLISRHGERYPSKGLGKTFEAINTKFENYKSNQTFVGELAFLNDYEYFVHNKQYYEKETTPQNSEGTYAGTTNALNHGAYFRTRYNALFNSNQTLPVFTSNSGRVHLTSRYFARGFLGDDYSEDAVHYAIIDEDGSMGANSLTPRDGCTNFNSSANDDIIDKYDKSYLGDIAKRLTAQNPGLNLTNDDVSQLFQWCAFEINVNGSSPFCDLFSNEEYVRSSYAIDVDNYYSNGPGNNLTRTIGAPFLNATLQLLTGHINATDNNKIWLSFTHDTDIEIYHAALGLVEPKEDIPTDHVPFPNPYVHSSIVPQLARVYTEKFSCGGNQSYVRFIVNDAVVPLNSCQDGPGFSCSLPEFEKYVAGRLDGINYTDQCGTPDAPGAVTFFWDYPTANYTAADIDA